MPGDEVNHASRCGKQRNTDKAADIHTGLGNTKDTVSLELFVDFLGLKVFHPKDFRPRISSKRCNFRSLKLTLLVRAVESAITELSVHY